MFLEKFEEGNLSFPFNTVCKDMFSSFLNKLKAGKVIVTGAATMKAAALLLP